MEMTGGRGKKFSFDVPSKSKVTCLTSEINSNLRRAFPLESELVGTAVPMAELEFTTVDHRLSRYFPGQSIVVTLPAEIAGSVELETCLIASWNQQGDAVADCPAGSLLWSDSWSLAPASREVLLEGSELRLQVETISFNDKFPSKSGALWYVELDPSIEPHNLFSNVVTIFINADILKRDFKNELGEPDSSRIPASLIAAIRVDLYRLLTHALQSDLEEPDYWDECSDGAVGPALYAHLEEAFETVQAALACFSDEPADFSKRLWDGCAPNSWRG